MSFPEGGPSQEKASKKDGFSAGLEKLSETGRLDPGEWVAFTSSGREIGLSTSEIYAEGVVASKMWQASFQHNLDTPRDRRIFEQDRAREFRAPLEEQLGNFADIARGEELFNRRTPPPEDTGRK